MRNIEMKEGCSKSCKRYKARHVCLQSGWWGRRLRQFAEAASAEEGCLGARSMSPPAQSLFPSPLRAPFSMHMEVLF